MLSKGCEYALRASVHLAALRPDGYVSIRDIGERLDISFPFLTKVFQKLTQAGIMQSFRGPNGGIRLARAPEEISLLDIVVAVDGPGLFRDCVLGLPGCGEQRPCPMHDRWAVERERLREMFQRQTLADTASGLQNGTFRLSSEGALDPAGARRGEA